MSQFITTTNTTTTKSTATTTTTTTTKSTATTTAATATTAATTTATQPPTSPQTPTPPPPPPQPRPHNRLPHHRHRHRHRRRPNHHHHLAKIELGHLFTRSGLTILEVSIIVSSGFFCLCRFLLSSVIYYWEFCLYVATIFFFIPVLCPELGLHLFPLQSRCLFYNLSNLCCCYFSWGSCFNGTVFTAV